MTSYPQLIHDTAVEIALEAGQIIRTQFDKLSSERMIKPDQTPLTMTDLRVNRLVVEKIAKVFPDHSVYGEEETSGPLENLKAWLCDPIDGTAAFVSGLPTGVFSLAYVEDGVPQVGVIYDPYLDRMYVAAKGYGVKVNQLAVTVHDHELDQSIIGSNVKDLFQFGEFYKDLRSKGATLAPYSGLIHQCANIAAGVLGARVFTHVGEHNIAAVKVIVEEAGGKVTDLDGNEQRYDRPINGAIVSSAKLYPEILALVKKHGVKVYGA
jgi:fructose-1,6-bisphosphatase/inositol monophosphatase family enzyme